MTNVTEKEKADVMAQTNDPSFDNIFQELKWRGLMYVSTDEEALEKVLALSLIHI